MAVLNAVGNSLTGLTGTGNFVGANTPTLITPVLGVATATSINFGGGALDAYVPKTTWTPVFTFATPGDLSLSGITNTSTYRRVGDRVDFVMGYIFTPTFTTSAGAASITGLPITGASGTTAKFCMSNSATASATYAAGRSVMFGQIAGATTSITLSSVGSAVTSANMDTTSFATGVSVTLLCIGSYFV